MFAKPVKLIPYVCGAGASTPGCESGPLKIKELGFAETLRAGGVDASWHEDPVWLYETSPWGRQFHDALPHLGSRERHQGVLWHSAHLRDQVAAVIRSGAFPLTLGGDHSMASGSIAGLAAAKHAHGRIGLLWVDAHPDINTPFTSPSQALHGMPVSALLGMGDPDFAALGGGPRVIDPGNIFYVGVRDIDPGEEDFIRSLGIHVFDAEDVRVMGTEKAFQAALETVAADADYLCLSLDLDAFDPSETPAVGTPVAGGLLREETFPVLKALMQEEAFDLIEITEFNPALPDSEKTYEFLKDLALNLLV